MWRHPSKPAAAAAAISSSCALNKVARIQLLSDFSSLLSSLSRWIADELCLLLWIVRTHTHTRVRSGDCEPSTTSTVKCCAALCQRNRGLKGNNGKQANGAEVEQRKSGGLHFKHSSEIRRRDNSHGGRREEVGDDNSAPSARRPPTGRTDQLLLPCKCTLLPGTISIRS